MLVATLIVTTGCRSVHILLFDLGGQSVLAVDLQVPPEVSSDRLGVPKSRVARPLFSLANSHLLEPPASQSTANPSPELRLFGRRLEELEEDVLRQQSGPVVAERGKA